MGTTRTMRDLQPTHYLFKIDSYSLLDNEKYESSVFEAGDYKWKLSFYPNGDKKRNGNGYISLYLTIVETDDLPPGWEVNVDFKLFVLDQLQDKYLTIQEHEEGAIRRFRVTKTEWGFAQLVSLDEFKDASHGYLVDDSCVLGAEVFVLKCSSFKFYCLSPAKESPKDTYAWKIEKFSTLHEEVYLSEVCALGGIEWKLKVFPKGSGSGKGKALSVYLQLVDVPQKHKVSCEFSLRIKDQIHGNHHELTTSRDQFCTSTDDWGFAQFITHKDLHDASKGVLKNDTMIIEVQVTKVTLVK